MSRRYQSASQPPAKTVIRAKARIGPLTGTANRRSWDDEIDRELARARRTGDPLTVALLTWTTSRTTTTPTAMPPAT